MEPTLAELLTVVWLVGMFLCAMPVAVGAVQLRRLRRNSRPWSRGQRIVDVLASEAGLRRSVQIAMHDSIDAPATGGIMRRVILFPIDAPMWPDGDVVRAAVHELEHVRRCDCLINVVTRLACALYWFQPLVWVASRRLGLEAERACDDAVLRRAEATTYADQLVVLAGRVTATVRQPLLAMANRHDLVQRVAAVLDEGQARGRVGRAAAIVIIGAAVTTMAALSSLQASQGQALVPANSQTVPSGTPAFEVAAVRQSPASAISGPEVLSSFRVSPSGIVTVTNYSLRRLVVTAYGIGRTYERYTPEGGPANLLATRFDITAKVPVNPLLAGAATTAPAVRATALLMLRTLLADRFKLRTHVETRQVPVYALTVAREGRLGPELRASTHDCEAIRAAQMQGAAGESPRDAKGRSLCSVQVLRSATANDTGFRPLVGQEERNAGPLSRLLAGIDGFMDRPLIDRTGLIGNYEWQITAAVSGIRDAGYPDISTALQEQLGLKLEPGIASIDVLVIDSVELPSEN